MSPGLGTGGRARRRKTAPDLGAALEAPPKKAKAADAHDKLGCVISVLDRTPGASDLGKELLRRLAHGALLTLANERHAYQIAAVEMLRGAFKDVETTMENDVDVAKDKVEQSRMAKASREKELSTAHDALLTHGKAFTAAQRAFVAENVALQSAAELRQKASQALETAVGERRGSIEQKTKLEQALKEHYPALMAGTIAPGDAGADALFSLLESLDLEVSLLRACSVAARKPASKRGLFDQAALAQLGPELSRLYEALDGPASQGKAEVEQRKEEDEQAVSRLAKAQDRMRVTADALRASELELRQVAHLENLAKEGVQTAGQHIESMELRCKEADGALEAFRAGPLAAFEALAAVAAPAPAQGRPADSGAAAGPISASPPSLPEGGAAPAAPPPAPACAPGQ